MNLSLHLHQEGGLDPSQLVELFDAKGYDCEQTAFDHYTHYQFNADRSDYIQQLKLAYVKGKGKVDWL